MSPSLVPCHCGSYFGLSALANLSPTTQKLLTRSPGWLPIPSLYFSKIHQESKRTLDHILFCQTCDRHLFSDHDDSKVTLICGEGSGNELGSTGFVGRGLLSANVWGDVFASPSARQAYGAMKALPSKMGTVVIVAFSFLS